MARMFFMTLLLYLVALYCIGLDLVDVRCFVDEKRAIQVVGFVLKHARQ